MRRSLFVVLMILCSTAVFSSPWSDAEALGEEIRAFNEGEDSVIVLGDKASNIEKLALSYFRDQYSDLRDIPIVSEHDIPPNKTLILIGGPMQNGVTASLDISSARENTFSAGKVLFIDTPKYMIFSDYAGFENRVKRQDGPLSGLIPEEWIPAAATLIGLSLLWLWHILEKLFKTVGRVFLSGRVMKFVRKQPLSEYFMGFELGGMRFKLREWISILLGSIVFAWAVSYTYLLSTDTFAFILTNIAVNIGVFGIRDLTRLLYDKIFGLHTEYRFWWWGALVTTASGLLGSTFALSGYVVGKDTNDKSKESPVAYAINLVTFLVSVILFFWNIISPTIIIQMAMVLSMTIPTIQFLPLEPFSGKHIYRWNKKVWWFTAPIIFLTYIAVNIVI
ncbi:hypothetical protein H6504_05350 [Candidatus Woesearchaeota archaeon]|nr:hypothetical protein [Candidatus Woesearchaeota archaeon]